MDKGNRQIVRTDTMTLTQRITEVLQQRKIMQEKRERAAKREHLIDQITYLQQRKTKTQMQ